MPAERAKAAPAGPGWFEKWDSQRLGDPSPGELLLLSLFRARPLQLSSRKGPKGGEDPSTACVVLYNVFVVGYVPGLRKDDERDCCFRLLPS